jgi:peptidoglycan/LPS O-acetylase OafA/YrhL
MKLNQPKANLKILDTLRGFAAIYVLLGHARWLLWEGFKEGYNQHPGAYSLLDKVAMYFFTIFRFGHEAVLFFFVLSGFVIHWSMSKRMDKTGTFGVKDYLVRRFKRIYPPLLVAIIITFAFDTLGIILKFPVYFGATPYSLTNANIHPSLTGQTLLGNMLFVQRVYTPVWGTDGPLWSLMYEWWFYILYIPFCWLFRKNKYLTSILVFALWVLSNEFNFQPALLSAVLSYFVAWYLGLLLADLLLDRSGRVELILSYMLGICAFSLFRYSHTIGSDMLLGVGFTCLLFAFLVFPVFRKLNDLHKLGAFSYTLYVIHFPMICFFSGFIMSRNNGRLPMHSGYIVLGVAMAIAIAWVLHFVAEKPFISSPKKAVTTQLKPVLQEG